MRLASRMEQGGAQGVVDDVTRFARRRPGAFLAGAAGVGFVVGRLVRAGAASQRERRTVDQRRDADAAERAGVRGAEPAAAAGAVRGIGAVSSTPMSDRSTAETCLRPGDGTEATGGVARRARRRR